MTQKIGAGLLEYAGKIWDTADTLRGAGIKESEWPTYMMPFFALMMLESRLRRFKQERIAEFEKETGAAFNPEEATHAQWLDDSAKAINKGYHKDLLLYGKGLRETCSVPGGNFLNRLLSHLNQYDPDTKKLLGIDYAQGSAKFLDMQGKASDLNARDNNPLYPFAQKWASIDLTPFNNSEITTIEEHIKRKWADISAETAGEQYTPSDVIDLATAIIIELRREGKGGTGIADVYDMACGGGNFLFATEDALRDAFPELSIRTRGQDNNDALFALASIESRFREDAKIEWGNTLTNDLFLLDKFDAIVANPPYGIDWKDFKQALGMDASGRFDKNRMPPTDDGQLLFLQHAAFHLSDNGVAAIVHSGSSLFSGEAGGGESETRRWLIQEQDIVEAIIQLPKGEFFNTDISTYLWILNRAKPKNRKGHVLLINAESCATKRTKNLNKKNCEIVETGRARIVQAFQDFTDGPISRKLPIDALLYNNVELELHRHDEQSRAIQEEEKIEGEKIVARFNDAAYAIEDSVLDLAAFEGKTIKEAIALFNMAARNAEQTVIEVAGGNIYRRNNETGAIAVGEVEKGLGVLTVKAKAAKSKGKELAKVEILLGPLRKKDIETVPYSSDTSVNEKLIADFLAKWVHEPWRIVSVKLGSEINFNRIFPMKSEIRPTRVILVEIADVEEQMAKLEAEIATDIRDQVKDEARSRWSVARLKECFVENNRRQPNKTVLSLSYGKIIKKDFSEKKGVTPESFDSYQGVHPGDVVLRLTDLQNDHKSLRVGYADMHGIITSAYLCVHGKGLHPKFSAYLLHDIGDIQKVFYGLGGGVRQSMKFADLGAIEFRVPPRNEQKNIAEFLNRKLAHVDTQLKLIRRLETLLKEWRQAIVHEAVNGEIGLLAFDAPEHSAPAT